MQPPMMQKMIVNKVDTRGFTLIEAIIYIALFSIIMTAGFVTAFQLMQGSGTISSKVVVQEEANFALRKINWALSGITTINTPTALAPYSATLSITKTSHPSNPVEIRLNVASSSIEMREGGAGGYVPITTQNVKVTSLGFQYVVGVGGAPDGIIATTTINGIVSTTTKYIRK